MLQVKNWVKELKKMLGSDIAIAICGRLARACPAPSCFPPSPLSLLRAPSSLLALTLSISLADAGNKIDLEKNRTVDEAEAQRCVRAFLLA